MGERWVASAAGSTHKQSGPSFLAYDLRHSAFQKRGAQLPGGQRGGRGGDGDQQEDMTLGEFLKRGRYSYRFCEHYIVPVCASIWSCSPANIKNSSARSILSFLRNHHMLQLFGRPQWLTVKGRSEKYVEKVVRAILANPDCKVLTGTSVETIIPGSNGVRVTTTNGASNTFDACVLATHAPDALHVLGEHASDEQRRVLGAFVYSRSKIYLHRDISLLPASQDAWSAWNFMGGGSNGGNVCVTYLLNRLQNLTLAGAPVLVTLNPPKKPTSVVSSWEASHPVPSRAASRAIAEMKQIQGRGRLFMCGAYAGYGFHEDGVKSGFAAAAALLGQTWEPLSNPPQFVLSSLQSTARSTILSFLRKFIRVGHLSLLETGGSIATFGELLDQKSLQGPVCLVRIHRPEFYYKVAMRADLGIADAYTDGDFECADDIINLVKLLILNRDHSRHTQGATGMGAGSGGWWSVGVAMATSFVGSATAYMRHLARHNSITNAQKNIADHYDLSNDMFKLFLDESMTYSCAIFKTPEDTLYEAQLRKLDALLDKAGVASHHHVLEIGFGWGSLAMRAVQRFGCRVTGITLSKQQMALAQERVDAAGMSDRITFRHVDYRLMEGDHCFDRILSCEMLEAVGHEFLGDFYKHCDRLLAPDGVMAVQVITTPEERYEEYRRSSDFIKEYIFPGCCVPSFAALTAAMASSSTFCVEAVENIGVHYAPTLLLWRKQFLAHAEEIKAMGFNDKFIRVWDYYFAYCAAGFATRTLGDIQVVYSRAGNVASLPASPYVV
eukprot:jgi/Mesvir1/26678/Mv20460-RA.1